MSLDTALKFTLPHEGDYIEGIVRKALFAESAKHSPAPYIPINNRGYNCSIQGCSNIAMASGYCNGHYLRKRLGKPMDVPFRNRRRGVECIECGKPTNSKGAWFRCQKHYKQKRTEIIKTALIAALGGRCEKCHGDYPPSVYDFHHLGNKEFTIGSEILNKSIKELAFEAAKCKLLCANCHRMEHNES